MPLHYISQGVHALVNGTIALTAQYSWGLTSDHLYVFFSCCWIACTMYLRQLSEPHDTEPHVSNVILETSISPAWTGPIIWKLLEAPFDFRSIWKPCMTSEAHANRFFSWAFRGFWTHTGLPEASEEQSLFIHSGLPEASEFMDLLKSCVNRFCFQKLQEVPLDFKTPEVPHKFGNLWKSLTDGLLKASSHAEFPEASIVIHE